MSLVASVLEKSGIATVVLSVLPEVSAHLTAPRTLLVPFGLGAPVGPPDDRDTQRRVLQEALALTAEGTVPVTRVWEEAV